MVKVIFLGIFWSLVGGGIYYFFAKVIFGGNPDLVTVLKSAYFIYLGINIVLTLGVLLLRIYRGLRYSKQFSISFTEAVDAFVNKGLAQKDGYGNWTSEEYKDWLARKEAAKKLAEALVNALRRS